MTIGLVVAILAVLLWTVLGSALGDGSGPGEAHFLEHLRRDHPGLSVAAAPDRDLIDAARRVCSPEGLTGSDEAWLETLDIDPVEFADDAQSLCPTR